MDLLKINLFMGQSIIFFPNNTHTLWFSYIGNTNAEYVVHIVTYKRHLFSNFTISLAVVIDLQRQ